MAPGMVEAKADRRDSMTAGNAVKPAREAECEAKGATGTTKMSPGEPEKQKMSPEVFGVGGNSEGKFLNLEVPEDTSLDEEALKQRKKVNASEEVTEPVVTTIGGIQYIDNRTKGLKEHGANGHPECRADCDVCQQAYMKAKPAFTSKNVVKSQDQIV